MTAQALREALGAQSPEAVISWLNSLVYSDPGVGKTHLIGTAMDHKLTSPLLVIDIDGGVQTLRKRPDVDVRPVRKLKDLIDVHRILYNAIPTNGKDRFPYGTVAIDTITELQSFDLAEVMKRFARENDRIDPDIPDQRGYGKSGAHMREIIRIFRDLPCNTIFAAHAQYEQDNNGRRLTLPKLVGKTRTEIAGFLDIVGYYRMEVDGDIVNRYLQTRGTATTLAKDRTGALDAVEINPTIPILWDKLQESNKGEK